MQSGFFERAINPLIMASKELCTCGLFIFQRPTPPAAGTSKCEHRVGTHPKRINTNYQKPLSRNPCLVLWGQIFSVAFFTNRKQQWCVSMRNPKIDGDDRLSRPSGHHFRQLMFSSHIQSGNVPLTDGLTDDRRRGEHAE